MANWRNIVRVHHDDALKLPKPGVIVQTKVDDVMGLRQQRDLQVIDGVWCDAEGVPVSHEPTHWKPQ